MPPGARRLVSEEQYLALEREAEVRHELVGGEMVAMAGASAKHAAIILNVGAALRARLATTDCIVFGSDLRVHVTATGLYTYPDVVVGCGRLEFGPKDRDALTNPLALVEVLSPSTESYDRGAKFAHYRLITSLRDYVLVSQAERRVEVFHRTGDGTWAISNPLTQGGVALPGLGVELSLEEIYAKTERFDEPTPE
jgi:Uma2 family endonuclease